MTDELTPSAHTLLDVLIRLADEHNTARLSLSVGALAQRAGLSVGAVAKAKRILEEAGLIRVEPSPNRYRKPDTIIVLAASGAVGPSSNTGADGRAEEGEETTADVQAANTPELPLSDNAGGRAWLSGIFRRLDPSMTATGAEALASSDFYANLAWALEFLRRVLDGREMASALTHRVLELLCADISDRLDRERLRLSTHEKNHLEDGS